MVSSFKWRSSNVSKILTCLCLMTSVAPVAMGQSIDADKIRGETNVKPVTVLQNRYFVKSYRPEVGILLGSMLNEAYTDTRFVGGRVGMFVSEWLGFEVQAFSTKVSDTDDKKALDQLKYRPLEEPQNADPSVQTIVSPTPETNPIRSVVDFSTTIAPFYGKSNLMNKLIVYSDLYLSAGFSQVKTDQKNHFALSIGCGQRFYFSDSLSLRIDFKDRIYSETRADKDSTKHSYSFDIGTSYFFR